ncbi:MAG: aspartyl/asparaginyl beta-hydroxylase domain-containing protein [Chroococcidiopsidaceae cyanobacterium CP_BM_ER_R8_30]|nr:aspartyl/asparaginyl beta-hydroxylase domain-containing protein [Chroococcidiopsidaceae cyanobacterium CP_BM_ER_R8_30]
MSGFFDPSDFEFASLLESNWQIIRQELDQLRQGDFVPWPEKHLYGEGWKTFGFYAFGIKLGKNCKLCPETTKLLEAVPNLATAGFSSLAPNTHIAPHTGYPDGFLRCHLGLIIPEGCGIKIGSETRSWSEGKCLIFDDTLEHEAWNQGNSTRVVLLMDFKAPKGFLNLPAQPQQQSGKASIFGLLGKKR